MKKSKKILFILSFVAFLLTSCDSPLQPNNGGNENGQNKNSGENSNPNSDSKKVTANSKSSDIITVLIKNAKGFGTRWLKNSSSRAASTLESDETLVKLNEDGTWENALVLPEGLADWCNYQPVREVYQCPYIDKIEDVDAKGIYIVFSWYIDFWKLADTVDEEGNPVAGGDGPQVGQILYVKPDGSIIDIFAKEDTPGKINKITLNTYLKENDDCDYIKFDTSGNMFMLVYDQDAQKNLLARFHPISGETTYYKMPTDDIFIRNFELKSDGTYAYINAMVENYSKNNVYAIPVKSDAEAITLYEASCSKNNWSVSNLCYVPDTNRMYFFVDDWINNHEESGLYICKNDRANGLVLDKHYFNLPNWSLRDCIKYSYNSVTHEKSSTAATYVKTPGTYSNGKSDGDVDPNPDGTATYNYDAEYDYEGYLNHLKGFFKNNNKPVYFTLDYFRKYKDAVAPWNDGPELPTSNDDYSAYLGGWYNPYKVLYATDSVYNSDGSLKQESYDTPTHHLITSSTGETYDFVYGDIIEQPNQSGIADREGKTGTVLTEEKALKYIMEYKYLYFEDLTDEDGNVIKDENGNTIQKPCYTTPFFRDFDWILGGWLKGEEYASCPMWLFFTDREDGIWNGPIYPCGNAAYALSEKSDSYSGELLYTKDGLFLLSDDSSDWDKYNAEWSYPIQIIDSDGTFVMKTPDLLKDVKGYKNAHWEEADQRQEDDPWYKAPYQANDYGFVLKSEDGKSMYYYDGTTCKTIIDGKKLRLSTIYSFSLSNNSVIYNACSMNGGKRTATVTLKDLNDSEFDIDIDFDTLIETDIPSVEE